MSTLAVNKKAKFDYELLEEFEGGLVLTGKEVKAIKNKSVQLKGAFLEIKGDELWVKNMYVGGYAPAGPTDPDLATRHRKVLIHRRELKKLIGKKQSEGLTIVPISVYTKGDLVKLGFALARGKKKYEKRDSIKKRDLDRYAREEIKRTRFGN